ncbi:hypothetical protein G4177_15100 [Corallococcus sp. ZKHCc1 1396]|uniref:Uncharacterized protein n=1 Tax=Corallococcus soli TaxID=2710757 RepID=A0ABR9PNI8_9BACT|nr:hypothetical protein [Corallococcus soli]MBE4749491.1 hypothetical protein [Corallococcus soli]
MSSRVQRKALRLTEALVWYHFVPRASSEGAAWYEEYQRSGCEHLAQNLDIAVGLLRRRKLAEAKAMLDDCGRQLDSLGQTGIDRCVEGAARESWWTSLAYFHYHVEDHAAAQRALYTGQQVLADVVEQAPFLVAFSTRCSDFCLHFARIARSEQRWSEMWDAIQRGREMVRGEQSLCQLKTRPDVFMADAQAFFDSVAPENDVEREALRILTDRDGMLRVFEKRALGATMVPYVVTPYS